MKRYLFHSAARVAIVASMVTASAAAAKEEQLETQQPDPSKMIYIDITGTEGTSFIGTLSIYSSGVTHDLPLEGAVPHQLEYSGDGLILEVTQSSQGKMEINVSLGGNRSTSRVSGLGNRVRLSLR